MRKVDHLSLDGHLLQMLVTVYAERSITRAAQRLGVTQSAVSHLMDRLREITGDALFVKSGRGIAPTPRAVQLVAQAEDILRSMQRLTQADDIDLARVERRLTIAANELQRDLLLPTVFARLREHSPMLSLRVIPSGVPTLDMLRDGHCDLIISPRPPDGSDIVQKRLFDDRYQVFYDSTVRRAPTDRAEYEAAEHLSVMHEPQRRIDIDDWLSQQGVRRRIVVEVPGFSGIATFLRGTACLATLPGRLCEVQLAGFARAEVPLDCPTMPMYLIWHRRDQEDPLLRWVRQVIESVSQSENRLP